MTAPPPTQAEAAIAWHRARVPMTEDAYKALSDKAKQDAFTVAGATSLQLIADVQAAIARAIAQGTTLDDFKAAVGPQLTAAWVGTTTRPAARLETIFRTNVQTAYNAGRYAEATDPDTLALRPFWQYDAVVDGRTTGGCKAANGVILPADHPWWQRNLPPRHQRCRSTFHPLTRRQAQAIGVTANPPPISAAPGFGFTPT